MIKKTDFKLTDTRNSFKPFNYPWAYDAWLKLGRNQWVDAIRRRGIFIKCSIFSNFWFKGYRLRNIPYNS
jgi:hypothetical protein